MALRSGFPCWTALGFLILRHAVAHGGAGPTYPAIDVKYEFPASTVFGGPGLVSQSAEEALSFGRRVEQLSERVSRSEDLLGAFIAEANSSLSGLFPLVQRAAALDLRERSRSVPGSAFPQGVEAVLHDLSARAGDIDELHVDDSAALSALKQDALEAVAAQLEEAGVKERLADAAYVLASAKVRKLRFVGGCPRAMRGCPVGWTARGDACAPPSDYEGWCGDVDVAQMSASDKEAFAWKCGASWPCEKCLADFDGCPEGWADNAGLCVAPPEYDGICSPVMDFSTFSATRRAEWSAMCTARWPCA